MNEPRVTTEPSLTELEVFFGAASEAEASVYAQLPVDDRRGAAVSLAGSVTGPFCEYARTLPASVALHDLGAGETQLAEARVPDPCFWTPEMPYLYQVEVELRSDGDCLATAERTLAIRRLGADGRSLFLDARRWVPRAASTGSAAPSTFESCRDAALGLVVDDPTDDVCGRATREGVLLAACVCSNTIDTVRRLSTYGAVGLVIVRDAPAKDNEMKRAARNVILCQERSDDDESAAATWADAVVYRINDPTRIADYASRCMLPVIAYRPLAETAPAADSRAACDALQRDLAEMGDFAGYFV